MSNITKTIPAVDRPEANGDSTVDFFKSTSLAHFVPVVAIVPNYDRVCNSSVERSHDMHARYGPAPILRQSGS